MEEQGIQPIYKVSTTSKEVIAPRNELLDFIKEMPMKDRIFIERVYTIDEYKADQDASLPF